MLAWEEKYYNREEAREEGRAEGRAEGRVEGLTEGRAEKLAELVKKKLAKGQTTEEIADALEEDVDTIREVIASLS